MNRRKFFNTLGLGLVGASLGLYLIKTKDSRPDMKIVVSKNGKIRFRNGAEVHFSSGSEIWLAPGSYNFIETYSVAGDYNE